MKDAPKNREIVVFSPDGYAFKAVWFFGDWATTEPILGDPFRWEPVAWCELSEYSGVITPGDSDRS